MFYFIPDEFGTPDVPALKAMGLGHAFDLTLASRRVDRGPGGAGGMLVCGADRQVAYAPEQQTWRQLPTTQVWFGWDATAGPDFYARDKQLPGELVELSDGHQWLIPTARDFSSGGMVCVLPMAYELQADGKTWASTTVLRRYQRYWDLSLDMATNWAAPSSGKSSKHIGFSDMFELLAEGISINYRLSRLEVGVLGLLSSDQGIFKAVLSAAFGMGIFEALTTDEVEKKTR